ncbi:hypothetical protein C8R44DRAFT_736438 [Mycena epipterygia]|nr:hypothetical protein C8R44DRAFT_736438 [Mycena epipterygia]
MNLKVYMQAFVWARSIRIWTSVENVVTDLSRHQLKALKIDGNLVHGRDKPQCLYGRYLRIFEAEMLPKDRIFEPEIGHFWRPTLARSFTGLESAITSERELVPVSAFTGRSLEDFGFRHNYNLFSVNGKAQVKNLKMQKKHGKTHTNNQ